MICTLTARRLKPGRFDDFRAAWVEADEAHPDVARRWSPVYLTRDVNEHDVIVAFGMFNGSLDELRRAQEDHSYHEAVGRISEFVDEVLLDGAYEVLEGRS
jgi:hypothetical protein